MPHSPRPKINTDYLVVGGGLAGLAAAFELKRTGREVRLIEAGARLGGHVETTREDGFIVEGGPQGFLDDTPEMLAAIEALGLAGDVVPASDRARKRYLWWSDRLRALPGGPLGLLTTGVLSLGGKWKLLREASVPPRESADDESIHDFAARRVGPQVAERLVDAMVSGIFAGDARRLSLRASFPKMAAWESEHGSVMAGMKARRRAGGRSGKLHSLRGGMMRLVEAFADALGDTISLNTPVASLSPADDGWAATLSDGTSVEASVVIVATPASVAGRLLAEADAELAAELDAIQTAPIAVVGTSYAAKDVPHPLDGYGFLAPRSTGLRALGVLWESSLFDDRAPDGSVLMRTMVGGRHAPERVDLSDDELLEVVREEHAATMGIEVEPERTWLFRWRNGIAQYELGHVDRLARIEARRTGWPGLHLTGSSYRGVSMNQCVAEATRLVAEFVG